MLNYLKVINSNVFFYCALMCLLCLMKDKLQQNIKYKMLTFVIVCVK